MSSMTGPSFESDLTHSLFLPSYILNCRTADDMSRSGLLSTTLPMEVVMVSIYIHLVVSSWTTLLALMLEIPVVATILMDITSMDVS